MPSRLLQTSQRDHLTRTATRRGFSLIEMLIVVVMISLLALVAIPRFASGSDRRNMESARLRMASALSTARQAAIQKGEPVRFLIKANRVTVRRVAGITELISPVPLDTLYKVTVPSVLPGDSLAIDFNARGFAKLTSTTKIVLRRNGVTGVADDSLVVYSTGMVQR